MNQDPSARFILAGVTLQKPSLMRDQLSTNEVADMLDWIVRFRVVCSERVSQMSRTYNDTEALTHLLEEKERDLELTARLGQQLLSQNAQLESKIEALETELRETTEKSTQLFHDLQKKTEIIQILTNDFDDSPEDGSPVDLKFEVLKRKIGQLEEENKSLKTEATHLFEETEKCEEAEAKLVEDLVAQLESCRFDLDSTGIDIEKSKQREAELKEQVEHLQEKLQTTNERLEKALGENEEYLNMITMLRETQCELATELVEVKEKYSEIVSVVEEMKENAKKTKKKNQSTVRVGPVFANSQTFTSHNPDSIAAELECSLLSEFSLDSGLGASTHGALSAGSGASNYKKVFETFKTASHSSSLGSSESETPGIIPPRFGSGTMPPPGIGGTMYPGMPGGGSYDASSSTSDIEDDITSTFRVKDKRLPSDRLEDTLSRLSMSEIEARRIQLAKTSLHPYTDDFPTPDSIMSTSIISSYTPWKLPEKLQIVKPIEGSLTLHHWTELATPSMEGLLDEKPGVKFKGGADLEALGLQTVSLSDIEEDEEPHPGKSFTGSNHVYTYTNSTVMHPDDNTSLVSSYRGSHMSTAASSRMSSVCSTPVTRSRRNSTSTVSTTPCLARLLAERGIKAATPSTLGTPAYTPTATPCNSPDRPSSPVPDEDSHTSLGLPGFLMSSGAELLWKTLGSALKSPTPPKTAQKPSKALMRPDKKAALTGFRLVERIERIGLEEILSTHGGSPGAVEPGSPRTLHRAGLRRTVRSLESGPGVLGVPGRPGTGALEARLAHIPSPADQQRAGVRPDLGSVPSPPGLTPSGSGEALGTLSSIFFGRKGGLL
ncbi:HAP1 N-terminal conserved region [Nesidiocoris tenuis]|uniref:HAP1 N-terminal conserved region n=2 Tax=Nesidiocoris tenuis TaxID=355587 RepID=A0ABN7AYQ5_9HEMI|nr:HAP1 N-terminal conserved region [Nesidiocoris tenuis]